MTRAEAFSLLYDYQCALRDFANAGAVLAGHTQDGTQPTPSEVQRAADASAYLEAARSRYLAAWHVVGGSAKT